MSDAETNNFKLACVQLRTGRAPQANVEAAEALIREAAKAGADIIMTPEQTSLMELDAKSLFGNITNQEADQGLKAFRDLASELERWLLIGSLAVKIGPEKAANRSFLIGPDGGIVASYDKIHMFDVNLPGGETYRESKTYQPGTQAVIATLPWGRLGLSICYDLRFAGLYRKLAQAGADFISVPAAFTEQTGKAHWHILLRARAIETGCYIFAPAQGGSHENGRSTYGHSLIVSPWGEVIAEADTEPGVIYADIDPALVDAARTRVPSLEHDRSFTLDDDAKGKRAS